jgi:hypothetical protein
MHARTHTHNHKHKPQTIHPHPPPQFMDAINRRVATEALLSFAVAKEVTQHIFLTPQDIGAIADAADHLARSEGVAMEEGFMRVMKMNPARPAAGGGRGA